MLEYIPSVFAGLSLASILILMALGLSIIFGLMRVINMAHGEFMMVGAYTTYVVSEAFKEYLPASLFDYYFFAAVPMAFLVPAIIGGFCEVTIIRRLYGRPLDTLLATWGISLILIQTVRVYFGDTTALTPPSWCTGGWTLSEGIILPRNRLTIMLLCVTSVGMVYFVVYRTRFGLLLRATQQNRAAASVLGTNTRRIDALTFAFGSGLAGLAGSAAVLFDTLNPQMGQSYIVDCFLVVVAGGIGKLEGVLVAGLGLGFLAKFIEPWLGAVYAKIAILGLLILLIQRSPGGLFADKGRLAHD